MHVCSPLRSLGSSGLAVLEKDGESMFVIHAGTVSPSLLTNAMWTCQQIFPHVSQQWIKSHSRWNENPDVEIVDLPDGVSVGASGGNSQSRARAMAVACVAAHYAFLEVDSRAECPNAQFHDLVLIACEAVRNSTTIWKGRPVMHIR
jgi:hypothetical protein